MRMLESIELQYTGSKDLSLSAGLICLFKHKITNLIAQQ